MALDTYDDLVTRVLLHCPSAGVSLARYWIDQAFRRVAERRRWSWKIKRSQFIFPAVYATGTVTVTLDSSLVAGAGTSWTGSMVGRQFRLGTTSPIYTITHVHSATSLELDQAWGSATAATQTYEIYQAYTAPVADFHSLISVIDPTNNWRLHPHYSQIELDRIDPQRSSSGTSALIASADYTTLYNGTVDQPVQVRGTGNSPTSSGIYTGFDDALFTVEITTGGIAGTAVYKWKKDAGTYTTGVLTDTSAFELINGVAVAFPGVVTYTVGDIWVIRATARVSAGLPRFEIWPHQKAATVFPYIYESRPTDLSDAGAILPRYIRGDVLLDMALGYAARWPGTIDKPNPMFQIGLAESYELRAEKMIAELMRVDDEIYLQDIIRPIDDLGFAPMDAKYLQNHDA